MRWLLLAAALLPTATQAAEVTLGVSFGMSDTTIKAGESFNKDTGIGLEVKPYFLFGLPAIASQVGFFFMGKLGSSSLGSFPLTRAAIAFRAYAGSLPIRKERHESGALVVSKRTGVFAEAGVGLTRLAITDSTLGIAFNGSSLGATITLGVSMPLSDTVCVDGAFFVEGTVLGSSAGSATGGLSISGKGGLIGLNMTP